jgi:hypothetical protein
MPNFFGPVTQTKVSGRGRHQRPTDGRTDGQNFVTTTRFCNSVLCAAAKKQSVASLARCRRQSAATAAAGTVKLCWFNVVQSALESDCMAHRARRQPRSHLPLLVWWLADEDAKLGGFGRAASCALPKRWCRFCVAQSARVRLHGASCSAAATLAVAALGLAAARPEAGWGRHL